MVGQRIGNYRIVRRLGEGGMGAVYLAEHPGLGRRVAVKVLHPDLVAPDQMVQRFFNEARAASGIGHPGIVEVFDFGTLPDGRALHRDGAPRRREPGRRMTRTGRLPLATAADIAGQAASALAAAHASGIVHRDLKPDNLFLVPDPLLPGRELVKVLDFGIAKLAQRPVDRGGLRTRHRDDPGHAALHVARAVPREPRRRPPHRRLLAGRDPVRDAGRRAAVRVQLLGGARAHAHWRRAARVADARARRPGGSRRRSCTARWRRIPTRAFSRWRNFRKRPRGGAHGADGRVPAPSLRRSRAARPRGRRDRRCASRTAASGARRAGPRWRARRPRSCTIRGSRGAAFAGGGGGVAAAVAVVVVASPARWRFDGHRRPRPAAPGAAPRPPRRRRRSRWSRRHPPRRRRRPGFVEPTPPVPPPRTARWRASPPPSRRPRQPARRRRRALAPDEAFRADADARRAAVAGAAESMRTSPMFDALVALVAVVWWRARRWRRPTGRPPPRRTPPPARPTSRPATSFERSGTERRWRSTSGCAPRRATRPTCATSVVATRCCASQRPPSTPSRRTCARRPVSTPPNAPRSKATSPRCAGWSARSS